MPMPLTRMPRRLVAGVAVLLGIVLLPASSTAGPAAPEGAPGPIHAGNTFGWYGHGGLVWREEFVTPLHLWRVQGPGVVRIQHGMLTLNTSNKGTVSATLDKPGRA